MLARSHLWERGEASHLYSSTRENRLREAYRLPMGKCYRVVFLVICVHFSAWQVLPALVECASTPEGQCNREACPYEHGSGEDGTHRYDSEFAGIRATCPHHGNTHSDNIQVPSHLPYSAFILDTGWQLVPLLFVSTQSPQAGHLRHDLPPPRISLSRI